MEIFVILLVIGFSLPEKEKQDESDTKTEEVIYNETTDPDTETTVKTTKNYKYEYVDLGLESGTLWATCNLGASKPEDFGEFFSWGESSEKKTYTFGNCKWYDTEKSVLQKKGVVDKYDNLTQPYDVASIKWGKEWRTPDINELNELLSLKNEWTKRNGVNGRLFKGTNGNTLFLPACGYCNGWVKEMDGEQGLYWTSSTCQKDDKTSFCLQFSNNSVSSKTESRNFGYVVRPVVKNK